MHKILSYIGVGTPTRELLQIAQTYHDDTRVLEKIATILSGRKNDFAFEAYLQVGAMLEHSKIHRRKEEKRAMQLRGPDGLPLIYQWPDVECLAKTHGYDRREYYKDVDGVMSYVGYHVGEKGQPRNIRWKILDCVFHNPLPNVISESYMSEWGEPETRHRFAKMQSFLMYFSENPGRGDFRKAIAEWDQDLSYVNNNFWC